MYKFKNITPVDGLDYKNLNNARQNNYCWSMSELDDYIYVGTGRNILLVVLQTYFGNNLNIPTSIAVNDQDNRTEIWRYKKGSEKSWERVFKVEENREYGFRYMVNFRPFNGNPALYAASTVTNGYMKVYKSVNGVVWEPVLSKVKPNSTIMATSSRAMVAHRGKLYLAAIDEGGNGPVTQLYSSEDPEFFPWKLETPNGTNPKKNPQGAISNMTVFNNKIYLATSTDTGIQLWRTNGYEPKINDWTMIFNNGFGNRDNVYSLSIGVFKNNLYVSGTKPLPLSWAIPRGCDIVRVDKYDNYEVVVGLNRDSNNWPGFNNPFNVYAWQIQEYKNKLLITTFDDSTNMQLILELLLANRETIPLDKWIIDLLIEIYELVVRALNILDYPFGFNLYQSNDGRCFKPIFVNGLGNRYNYGGRILYVDSCDDLYLGTANPFEGLQVYKSIECMKCNNCVDSIQNDYKETFEELNMHFEKLEECMPQIREYLMPMLIKYSNKI